MAHHGGPVGAGAIGGSAGGASEIIELPITIGLDGSVSYNLGVTETFDSIDSAEMSFAFMPLVGFSWLKSDKRVQLKDGRVMRFRSKSHDIGLGTLFLGGGIAPIPGSSLQIGLMVTKGSLSSIQQIARNLEESFELPLLSVPLSLEELDTWNLSDQLSYSSQGTVLFVAGVGLWPVGVSTQVSATGSWVTSITKITKKTVRVLLRRVRGKSIGLSAGALVLELGKNIGQEFDSEFTFDFDLSKETSSRAYLEMLKGNLVLADALWQQKHEGISRVSLGEEYSRTSSTQMRAGIPFIVRYNFSRTQSLEEGEKDFFSEVDDVIKTSENSILASVTKLSSKILFNREVRRTQYVFAGGVNNHLHGEQTHRHPAGSFKWFFEKMNMSSRGIKKFFHKVSKQTGFSQIEDLNIPEPNHQYARVAVDLRIKEKGFEELFSRPEHALELRPKLMKMIRNLKAQFKSKKDSSFAYSMKELGKYLASNPQDFQSFIQATGPGGFALTATIEGESFLPLSWCYPKGPKCSY